MAKLTFRRNAHSSGRASGRSPIADGAVLREDTLGFYHVTRASSLPSIRRRGFSVKPRRRTFGSDAGELESLDGVYVAPEYRLREVVDFVRAEAGPQELVVLELLIPKGTRFCLDEDEIVRMGGLSARELTKHHGDDFGPHTEKLISKAVQACLMPEIDRDWLSAWTCTLAEHLDQGVLDKYRLRLFDPPVIVSAKKVSMSGRSSGRSGGAATKYPSERSPSFIASLPAERRALAERFSRVLSGRPHWVRFHEYLAEAPVGEIQADVAEREAAHARRGEQAKADAREEAQRRRKFRGAVEVEVDPKDRRKQRLSGQDVWLYHGTSSKLLPKIRREGLCPDPPRRAAPDTSSGYVYLTVRAGNAMARGGDAVFYARQAVGVFGGEPVVLRVRVPWDALDRDEDDSDIGTYHYQYRFAGCIRPEQIAEVLKV